MIRHGLPTSKVHNRQEQREAGKHDMGFPHCVSHHQGSGDKEYRERAKRQAVHYTKCTHHQEETQDYRSTPVLSELAEPVTVKHEGQMEESQARHHILRQDFILPEVE